MKKCNLEYYFTKLPEHKFKLNLLSFLNLNDFVKVARVSSLCKTIINNNGLLQKIKLIKKEIPGIASSNNNQNTNKSTNKQENSPEKKNVTTTKSNNNVNNSKFFKFSDSNSFTDYLKINCKLFSSIKKSLKLTSDEEILLMAHIIKTEYSNKIKNNPKHLSKIDYSNDNLSSHGCNIIISSLLESTSINELNLSNIDINDKSISLVNLACLIKRNKSMTDLKLNNCAIKDKTLKKIIYEGLTKLTSIISLHLQSNEISRFSIDNYFSAVINTNPQLQILNLSNNLLGGKGVELLVNIMVPSSTNNSVTEKESVKTSSLKNLDLSYNGIDYEGANHLYRLLIKSGLKELKLNGNLLSESGFKKLADGLKVNKNLSNLEIANCKLMDTGLDILSDALSINTSLESLNISSNCISDKGVLSLSETMKIKTFLRKLNISNNKFTLIGVKYLSNCLNNNTTIQELSLEENNLGVEYIKEDSNKEITNSNSNTNSNNSTYKISNKDRSKSKTKSNSSSKYKSSLDFNSNNNNIKSNINTNINTNTNTNKKQISTKTENFAFLSNLIKNAKSLSFINLSNTNISNGMKLLVDGIKASNISTLNLSGNYIDCDGVSLLSSGLKALNSIKILTLEFNNIADTGCKNLSDALRNNKSIESIFLGYNYKITFKGVLAFKESVKTNTNITVVDFSGIPNLQSALMELEEGLKVNRSLKVIKLR